MKYFFWLVLTFFSSAAFSQFQGGLQSQNSVASTAINGKISGIVTDSIAQQPVEFANVALVDIVTDKPIDGTVCDEKGKFTLNKIATGEYNLVITFIGFENKSIPVKITNENDNIDLGQITINPSIEILKEVVIQGQRALIEEKVDRTIYNAENDATTRGGDATDVLKRVPMLSVDLDGNVSLRGSQNIRVLINNKPSTIAASSIADALKMIPADEIKSVEVITSPSAKYDAEGSGGIINIITKKNNLQGVSLNIDGGAGYRGSNLGLNGSYRKKKMGFSIGGFGRSNYNTHGSFENTQTTTNDDETIINIQSADTRNSGLFGRYTLGWDYDIDKNNSINASVKYGVRNNNSFQENLLTSTNGVPTTFGDVTVTDLSGTVDASLDYTHTFATPQHEFSILTLYSRNNRTNDFLSNSVDESEVISRRKNLNASFNQEITIQLDYQTPLGTAQMLEFGGKNISRNVSSDYKYLVAGAEEDFVPSTTQQPNVFDYTQNVTAGYLSYTLSFLKTYSLKAGGRYEYTTIDANFQNLQDGEAVDNIPSYGVIVPSVNLSKKLKNGNMVKASFNRRIQRPSIQFLNPNLQFTNNINYTQGNPTLAPEFTNNYELSYSTYIKGSSLNFSTFYRNSNDAIQSIRDTVEGGGILTTYKNAGSEEAYGVNIFANVNIGSKFSLNGGTDIYYSVLNNNVADPRYNASNEGWVMNGRIFGSYNIGKGWGAQFFTFFRGKQVQLQGTQGGFRMYSLGLKKDFNEKKGSIGFGVENFLTPSIKIRNESVSPILSQNSLTTLNNFNFKVTFSYRIGKMSFDEQKKRKKSINNDDLKDGGGDNQGGGGMQQQGPPQQGGSPGQRNKQGQQPTQGKPAR